MKYKNKELMIKARLGFISFKINKTDKPEKEKEKKEKKPKEENEKPPKLSAFIDAYAAQAAKIRKHVLIKKLKLHVDYGHEDAAVTGIVTGLSYAIFYQLFILVAAAFSHNAPDFTVTPVFNDPKTEVDFHGIIQSRLAHIIGIAYGFAKKMV